LPSSALGPFGLRFETLHSLLKIERAQLGKVLLVTLRLCRLPIGARLDYIVRNEHLGQPVGNQLMSLELGMNVINEPIAAGNSVLAQ